MIKKIMIKLCDVCKKELTNDLYYKRVVLPCKSHVPDSKHSFLTSEEIDLCEDCYNKLYNVICNHFAVIESNYRGVTIKKREEIKY